MSIRRPAPGFTLIELLVVLFIIGIIAAMATLSVGTATKEKGTDKEIERIEDLIALASEEAVLQGREFGLTFYEKEYEFSTYDISSMRWTPLAGSSDNPFSPRAFPPEAVVDLEVEDRMVKLTAERPKRAAPAKGKDLAKEKAKAREEAKRWAVTGKRDPSLPQVFIYSSGDVQPFKLRLRPNIGSKGITLVVAENGSVKKVRDER
jgi:general secretion pathway protein H